MGTANSLAIIIPDDQTVALKIMSHQKKLESYEEMADYRFRVGNVQNEPKISHCARKQGCKDKWGLVKTTQ